MSILPLLALTSCLCLVHCTPMEYRENVQNKTVHMFYLLVPETTVKMLRKARQEEEATPDFAQTGAFVGQIISGVLGGDIRPVLAGSVKFVDNQSVQTGLGGFFQTIGPAINFAFKQAYLRGQSALGFTPTRGPVVAATAFPNKETFIEVETGNMTANGGNGTVLVQVVQTTPKPLPPWQYVLSQLENEYTFSSTTAQPLPFLKPIKQASGEDSNEDS